MKRILLFILMSFLTANINAKMKTFNSTLGTTKAEALSGKSEKRDFFPPLGIEMPDFTYARTKLTEGGYPINKDATRFLEKAVNENNVENAVKFLKAGASAFITYQMIDKKQYEMIDAMYNDNPRLIRYSQLLHYACANSDTTMIDFLIDRKASLDLYGYYVKYTRRRPYGEMGYQEMCEWNGDYNYKNTPADVALYHQRWDILNHIMNKYHKYPTIYGSALFLHFKLKGEKPDNNYLELVQGFVNGDGEHFQFMNKVDYTIKDVINQGYHEVSRQGDVINNYVLITTVIKIAQCRATNNNRDKIFLGLLNQLIEKGANLDCEIDNGATWRKGQSIGIRSSNYVNDNALYIALSNKNMMDVVKLLREKGASMTTTYNGKKVSLLKLPGILDEYKEYFMLEGIQ